MRGLAIVSTMVFGIGMVLADEKKDSAKTESIKIGPAKYPIPTSWKRERPKGLGRVIQFEVPGADASAERTEFFVSYFQGQGGGVADNLKRWKGFFSDLDGKEKVAEFDVGKLKVTTLDIAGTYKAPFAADQPPKKDHRMLAAIVETPDDGPYFFRLVGPKATIESNAEAFKAMLKGATLP